jgi:hypoxanthine phosphoribosyltransferase
MTITEYENSVGELMVLVVDEVNDTAESMSKAEYDRRQAEQSTPKVADK